MRWILDSIPLSNECEKQKVLLVIWRIASLLSKGKETALSWQVYPNIIEAFYIAMCVLETNGFWPSNLVVLVVFENLFRWPHFASPSKFRNLGLHLLSLKAFKEIENIKFQSRVWSTTLNEENSCLLTTGELNWLAFEAG